MKVIKPWPNVNKVVHYFFPSIVCYYNPRTKVFKWGLTEGKPLCEPLKENKWQEIVDNPFAIAEQLKNEQPT